MGLHAQIHQQENEVRIALSGEIRSLEYRQLAEIVNHFKSRGCHQFIFDLKGIWRLNAATEASLRRLVDHAPVRAASHQHDHSAIRLMADNPAVRPQTDCGDLLLTT